MSHLHKYILIIAALVLGAWQANAGHPTADLDILVNKFNHYPAGTYLTSGNAFYAEPTDLGGLTAEVVEDTPGDNELLVQYPLTGSGAKHLRWNFLGDSEITEGTVNVIIYFTPPQLGSYSIGIRESGGSASNFLNLNYTSQGTVLASDAAGPISLSDDSYSAGVTQEIIMTFDMDAGTSALSIDGDVMFDNRQHGITSHGVGRLLTGFNHGNTGTSFILDDLVVQADAVELPLVMDADFEQQTTGDSLGIGSPGRDEPINIDFGIYSKIFDDGQANQAVFFEKESENGNLAQSITWEFINNREFDQGMVVIEFDIEFDVLGETRINIRESGGSASSFASISINDQGLFFVNDANGSLGLYGSVNEGQLYTLTFEYDMDTGSYALARDGVYLFTDRQHGVTTGIGIGRISLGFAYDADINTAFILDNFQVGASADFEVIFNNGFE